MADNPQTLAAILNSLAQNFRPEVIRTINRRSVLIKTLPIMPGEGKNVGWDIETDGMIGESFSDGDDAANFGSDAVQQAILAWGLRRANYRVTDLAKAAAKSSKSPTSLLSLWQRNVVNASMKVASDINAAFYSSSSGIIGLDTALDDANTYAGILRSTGANAGFRAKVLDPGTPTVPTLSQIRDDITVQIYKNCGEQPDLAFCSPEIFRTIGDQFEETRRRTEGVREITTAKGKVVLDGSIGSIEFEGCIFIKDKDATAGSIYYLNSNYVHIEYLPQEDAELGDEAGADMDLSDGFGVIPLGIRHKVLASQGSSSKATAQVFVQLVVQKPNSCAIRKNVKTS